MKIPFRQGLIGYQLDGFGLPQFLLPSTTPGYVALNIAPTPCSVAFAHGSSDYLQVFAASVPAAWGPLVPNTTSYLYWDIDLLTSAVTYGFTTLEPVVGAVAPANPPSPVGSAVYHWFDTSTSTMKVWKGSVWQNVVRAFAGRVNNNTNNITAEPIGQSWKGALLVAGRPGYISTDIFGNPIRTVGGEFVTTTTPVRFNNTVGTSGVLAVLPNAYVAVRASESIPAMSLVYFSGEGTVGLATGNPAFMPARVPIGIVQDELSVNEVGSVTQSGEVSYDQWDWSAHIGKPLYCGNSGQIVHTRPEGLLAYRVGFVKNAQTVLFQVDAETLPQVYQANANDIIINGTTPISSTSSVNGIGERVWDISMPAATTATAGHMTAAQALAIADHATRITTAETDILGRSLVGHGHVVADVTGLQVVLDGKAPLSHNHDGYHALEVHNHDGYHAPAIHTHTIPDVQGLQTELNGKAPLIHTHTIAAVDGLQIVIDTKVDKVPAAVEGNLSRFVIGGNIEDAGVSVSDFALANHNHSISQVTGLQVAIDGKAALVHGHAISEVTGLQAELDGKAAAVHGHVIADVTDLQAELNGKAAAIHGHAISEVTGLQAELDGKAAAVHGHVIADVTGLQTAIDDVKLRTDGFGPALGVQQDWVTSKVQFGQTLIASPTGTGTGTVAAPGTMQVDVRPTSINALTDVDTVTAPPANGNALVWNGTNWVPGAVSGGGGGGGTAEPKNISYWRLSNEFGSFSGNPSTIWVPLTPYQEPTSTVAFDDYTGMFTFGQAGTWKVEVQASAADPAGGLLPDGLLSFGIVMTPGSQTNILSPSEVIATRFTPTGGNTSIVAQTTAAAVRHDFQGQFMFQVLDTQGAVFPAAYAFSVANPFAAAQYVFYVTFTRLGD